MSPIVKSIFYRLHLLWQRGITGKHSCQFTREVPIHAVGVWPYKSPVLKVCNCGRSRIEEIQ